LPIPNDIARWRVAVFIAGVALLIVGGGFHSGDLAGLTGIVLIVVSALVRPSGRERYRRVCARLVADAARAVGEAEGRFCMAEAKRMDEFGALRVPERFAVESRDLLLLFKEKNKLHLNRAGSIRNRALRRRELRDRIRDLQTRVAELAATEVEVGYGAKLTAMLAASEQDNDERMLQNGQTLSQLVECQEDLLPPEPFRYEHDLMCRGFREELTAMLEYYAASREGDSDAIRGAAQKYEDAVQLCATRLRALGIHAEGALATAKQKA
jgi:hypothetical protein